jgi:hypothetical protein
VTDAVALPPAGDGSRRNRRPPSKPARPPKAPKPPRGPKAPKEPREPRERQPLPLRQVGLVVGAVAVVLGLVLLGSALLGGDDDPSTTPTTVGALTGERTTTLLLVRDGNRSLTGATVLVSAAGGGGVLLYVPPGTMLETPSLGLVPLRDAARDGDELARVTVENLFGVRLDGVASVDPAGLAAAVEPAGTLTVRLPSPVQRRVEGRTETVFAAGPASVAPGAVSDLLSLPGGTDIQRMVRHQAFWDAWLAAIRSDEDAVPSGAGFDDVDVLARGPVTHLVLPVEALGGGDELYKVDNDRLETVLPRAIPGVPSRGSRITVQVLNGTGRPGATASVLPALVSAGARVSLTGNADRFDYAETQVVFYDDASAAAAQRLRDALGVGQVLRSRAGVGAVQVTVVVGSDFGASSVGTTSTTQGATP